MGTERDENSKAPGWGRTLRRLIPVFVVFGLVVFVMAAASLSSPQVTQVPLPSFTPRPPVPITQDGEQPMPSAPGFDEEFQSGPQNAGGSIFTALIWGVVITAFVVGLVWLLRRFSFLGGRSLRVRAGIRSKDELADEAAEEVREAVRAGIDDLEDDTVDPRRAVISCWLRLEHAAAAAGTARAPGDTPTDLVVRMLGSHRVSARSLHRIAALYRGARYSPDEVAEDMRVEARSTLTTLLAELGRPRAAAGSE